MLVFLREFIMYIERSIPCTLNARQLAVTFRDLGRLVDYFSIKGEVAVASPKRLICSGSNLLPNILPGWVVTAEMRNGNEEVILSINTDKNIRSDKIDELFENLISQLSGFFRYPVKPFPQRVFCIGWSKTGTTSLTEALRILGLFSCHSAPWVIGLKHRTDDITSLSIDFSSIADYTAMLDLPIYSLFKELDRTFPDSLFILTTRSVEEWSESTSVAWNQCVEGYGTIDSISRWAHGMSTLNINMFQERYLQHEREVLKYFGDRNDLLVIDVTTGNPWPALCRFLKLPEPDVPFPHLNRRPAEILSELR
ncbi:MAG: sulfotransferase family protein [Methylococcales bacterium]